MSDDCSIEKFATQLK